MNLLPAAAYRPQRFGTVEAAIMRVLLAAVVWWSLPLARDVADLSAQKSPTGLATFIDLTWLSAPGVFLGCQIVLGIALALYATNRLMLLATGTMALVHILLFTLDNSQGATNHAYQLLSLVQLAQFLTYLSPTVIRLLERWKKTKFPPLFAPDIRLSDLAIFFTQQTIAGAYLITGLTKLIRSKGLWVWQSPNLSVELLKSNAQNFYNRLETDATYDQRLAVAQWMIDHPMLTRALMGGGLVIELGALLALRGRAWALGVGIAVIALHWGIDVSMGLFFKFHIALVIIYFINVPYWITRLIPAGKTIDPPATA